LSEGAATGEAAAEAFEGRKFKQEERVADIIRVRFRADGKDGTHGFHQAGRLLGCPSLAETVALEAH
jgi:hypothetical protein